MLLAVTDTHLDTELFVNMFRQMLGRIHTAMLTTRTTETEHQRGEATLDVTAYMGVGQFIHRVEERQDLAVVFQESDHGLVEARQLLIRLITAGIVRATTVEHVTATVAALILRDTLGERETEHAHHQRTLGIILREGGRTILRMRLIGIQIGGLITVGTTADRLYLGILRQFNCSATRADSGWQGVSTR